MIEESIARTKTDYTPVGTFEVEEKCSVCEDIIPIGTHILRENHTKKVICKKCINEVKKIA